MRGQGLEPSAAQQLSVTWALVAAGDIDVDRHLCSSDSAAQRVAGGSASLAGIRWRTSASRCMVTV